MSSDGGHRTRQHDREGELGRKCRGGDGPDELSASRTATEDCTAAGYITGTLNTARLSSKGHDRWKPLPASGCRRWWPATLPPDGDAHCPSTRVEKCGSHSRSRLAKGL